jgi:2-polyprenyl-3-methyl-5-hydroxy-6-metoxy-1,4-benzoquinol methylase
MTAFFMHSLKSARLQSVNLIMSQDMFEHVENPAMVLCEVHRILKPKGKIIFKIPNNSSIFGVFARLTPFWIHKLYRRMSLSNCPDVSPTFYRFNDRKTIESFCLKNNFRVRNIEYFCSFPPAPYFMPFFIYNFYILALKIINMSRFKHFSDIMICCLERSNGEEENL